MIKASVIIPTVNRAGRLEVLLRSIARNTVLPYEAVIIEQGDAVKTREFIESKQFPFPVRVYYQEQKSSSIARNRGVEEAGGEILFFLDDDMEIGDSYIEISLEYFQENPSVIGITGSFTKKEPAWNIKKFFAIFFLIYSWRMKNIVLPSGSYDFIRGRNYYKDQTVEWMWGGNMILRRKIFDEGFVGDDLCGG